MQVLSNDDKEDDDKEDDDKEDDDIEDEKLVRIQQQLVRVKEQIKPTTISCPFPNCCQFTAILPIVVSRVMQLIWPSRIL